MTTAEQIQKLCEKIVSEFQPEKIILFGSYAYGRASADSDIDLLVEYEADHGPPSLNDYFDFRDALAALLERKVDLVMANVVRNPYVRASIERSRQPLHGA